MSKFDIYSLILCIIVFVMLVGLFSYMLTIIIKQTLKHIKAGLDDEDIEKEFNSNKAKKQGKFSKAFNVILNAVLCMFFGVIFLSSLYINCTQNVYFDNFPTYRVVLTSSMEEKHEKNTYLITNNLNNQISAFDLIATYKIPSEEDLKLYDIVVYEVDGVLVIHRIVGIEEPNEKHPNQRHFLLQGDAVGSPDRFPVLYSQMRGIYRGENIPFVGSFVLFMQSPAGWLCILLIFTSLIVTPILEKKLLKARKERYTLISKQEMAVSELIVEENKALLIVKQKSDKTFMQRLALSSADMQNRYNSILQTLLRIQGIRSIEGKTQHSYKSKSTCIARLFFRGKTLNVCLGLDPKEYENSKYVYTDFSQTEKHKNYPMRLKQSSERQTRWTCDLILQLAQKHGLNLLDKPVEQVEVVSPLSKLKGKVNKKTFVKRLRENPIAKQRFTDIDQFIKSTNGVRVIQGKYNVTYKYKNVCIAKMTVKGKTLNVYLGLKPSDYVNTKYIFTDLSAVKKYANYPMRLRASSDRQVRWIKELIEKIIK